MSTPPSKLRGKLKAMSAQQDATAVSKPNEPQPFGDSVATGSNQAPDEFEAERTRRASVLQGRKAAEDAARTGPSGQLQSDLQDADKNLSQYAIDDANRKLTGTPNRKGK